MNKLNLDGRSWRWIGDIDRVGPQHVYQNVKHGGESVMIWGCMTAFGLGAWYKIEGRMDRHLYKLIFENFLWSTIQNFNLDPSRLVFDRIMIPSI